MDTVQLLGKLLLLSPVPAVYSARTHTLWERKKRQESREIEKLYSEVQDFWGKGDLRTIKEHFDDTSYLERVECVSVSPQLLCDIRNKGVQRDEYQQV